MAQTPFPIATFQYSNTQPVVLGYVLINLNKDCVSPIGQLSAGVKTKLLLDVAGSTTDGPTFWPNSQLTPSDVLYIYSVYTALGQRVLGPLSIVIGLTPNQGFGVSFGVSFGS